MRSLSATWPFGLAALALTFARLAPLSVGAELRGPSTSVHREGERLRLDDDVLGEHLTLLDPSRIVSATLASDVWLTQLGAADRVVGVTPTIDDPTYSPLAHAYPAVPRHAGTVESILALRPQLVVLSDYSRIDTARALRSAGVALVRLPPGNSLAELRASVEALGVAVHDEDAARALLHAADTRIDSLRHRPRRSTRVLVVSPGGFAHGHGTLSAELVALAGAVDVASELGLRGHARLPTELFERARPALVVVPATSASEARAALTASFATEFATRVPVLAVPPAELEVSSFEALGMAQRLADRLDLDDHRTDDGSSR